MTTPKLTSRDVLAALYQHFTPRWAMLTEVVARSTVKPGRGADRLPEHLDRRIDALLLRVRRPAKHSPIVASLRPAPELTAVDPSPPDGGIERFAIEVKVTRGDFLADVRNPYKQAPWRALAHRHAYAVPEGLISPSEVPPESGLIVIGRRRSYGHAVTFARRAPRCANNPGPLPAANIMDAFRRAGEAEARAKGFSYDLMPYWPEPAA